MTIKSTRSVALAILAGCLFSGCSLLFRPGVVPSTMWNKPAVLCDYPTNDKLVSNAKITGKIALTKKDLTLDTVDPNRRCSLDGYFNDPSKSAVELTIYFPEEMYATKPEEIDTLIKVETKRGNLLNSFTGEGGNRAKVYSCFIEISVIDYKTSTVLAKEQNEYILVRRFTEIVDQRSATFSNGTVFIRADNSARFSEVIVPVQIIGDQDG